MSTSNYTIQFHDALREELWQGKKRATGTSGTKKMQELNPHTSENYVLNSICVCVCHHSFPSMVMVSKQCNYTFTPAFSFTACTGTDLTHHPWATHIWTVEEYKNMADIYLLSYKNIWKWNFKVFLHFMIYTVFTLQLIFHHFTMKFNVQDNNIMSL